MNMNKNELEYEYVNWMYSLVCNEDYTKKLSYRKLLKFLHSVDFTYLIETDGNRFEDGIELRYKFGYENNYDISMISKYLDCRPCSVLEMMIALAIRLEEHIMDDPEVGNRTGQWFWNMIVNLGLGSMNDSRFNKLYVQNIIHKFLEREYQPNGKGGLFTIEDCHYNLREIEIWYQACWYLDNIT